MNGKVFKSTFFNNIVKKASYLHLEAFVLRTLLDDRCFSQKQRTIETIAREVPKHAREDQKNVKTVVNKMIARGLLKSKKKHYGTHVWLNLEKLDEIKMILAAAQV
jgi:hypothetical protein